MLHRLRSDYSVLRFDMLMGITVPGISPTYEIPIIPKR